MTKEWHRVSTGCAERSRLIGNSKRKKEHIFWQGTVHNMESTSSRVSASLWIIEVWTSSLEQWNNENRQKAKAYRFQRPKVRSKEYYGSNTYNIVQYLLRSAKWKCRLLRCLVIPNNSCKMLQDVASAEVKSGVLRFAQSPALCTTCYLSCRRLPLSPAWPGLSRLQNDSECVRWMRRGAQPTNQQSSHMTNPWSSFQWASTWERTGWRNTWDRTDKNGFKANLDCQAVLEIEGWSTTELAIQLTYGPLPCRGGSLPKWDPAGFWSQVQVTKLGNSRFTEEITSPNLGRSHNLPHLDTKMTTLEGSVSKENDVCARVWHNLTFKGGIAIWEGPIAYFCECNIRKKKKQTLLHVSSSRCFSGGCFSSSDGPCQGATQKNKKSRSARAS